jgi:hypothetical protein
VQTILKTQPENFDKIKSALDRILRPEYHFSHEPDRPQNQWPTEMLGCQMKRLLAAAVIATPFGAITAVLVTLMVNILRFGAMKLDGYLFFFVAVTVVFFILGLMMLSKKK